MAADEPATPRRAEPITKHVSKSGKVSYWFRADVGENVDGTRKRARFTYTTLKEARKELRRVTTQVNEGRYLASTSVTLAEHVEAWLAGRRDIRRVTRDGYRRTLRPALERLGSKQVQRLTKRDVDELVEWRLTKGRGAAKPAVRGEAAQAVLEFVSSGGEQGVRYVEVTSKFGEAGGRHLDRLLASGDVTKPARGRYVATGRQAEADEARGVSARTVVGMLVTLQACLEDARRQGLVTVNVAALVKRPKMVAVEQQRWSRDEMGQFVDHVADHRLLACWLLSLLGIIRSELLGLRWLDVDFNAATVSIRRGRVAIDASTTEVNDPKRPRRVRTLPMPADVMAALRRLKALQASERLAVGAAYPDSDFVAVHEDGTPIRPEWFTDEFRRQCKAAGVPQIRLYDTRHTAASLMLDDGTPVHAAAKWLGHDPAVLLRTYAHASDPALEAAGASIFSSKKSG